MEEIFPGGKIWWSKRESAQKILLGLPTEFVAKTNVIIEDYKAKRQHKSPDDCGNARPESLDGPENNQVSEAEGRE